MALCTCKTTVTLCKVPLMFVFGRDSPQWARASSFTGFLDHTRRATVGRTPLHEWSARRKDLYLSTHNTHNRQTSKPWVGFEPTISAGERPQTSASDRAAIGTGKVALMARSNYEEEQGTTQDEWCRLSVSTQINASVYDQVKRVVNGVATVLDRFSSTEL